MGTHLVGRRIYEALRVWDRPEELPDITPAMSDFAELWQAAGKVVYSRTLEPPAAARTRAEREFEPDAVRALKDGSDRTL